MPPRSRERKRKSRRVPRPLAPATPREGRLDHVARSAIFQGFMPLLRGIAVTLRPHQWVKNSFVAAPLVFAKRLHDDRSVWLALAAGVEAFHRRGVRKVGSRDS